MIWIVDCRPEQNEYGAIQIIYAMLCVKIIIRIIL